MVPYLTPGRKKVARILLKSVCSGCITSIEATAKLTRRGRKMKIAVSASGNDLDAVIDPRFGRCGYFILVETEDMGFEVFNNENRALGGGAGIQSAQFVASKGAQAVITGNCGPNAVRTLNAAGIEILLGQSGTVREAVEHYKQGRLVATNEANVTDHYGFSESAPAIEEEGNTAQGSGRGGTGSGRGMGRGGGMGRGKGMGGGMGCGRGRAGGRGMGMGCGPGTDAAGRGTASDEELSMLRGQTQNLRRQIEALESELERLKKAGDPER